MHKVAAILHKNACPVNARAGLASILLATRAAMEKGSHLYIQCNQCPITAGHSARRDWQTSTAAMASESRHSAGIAHDGQIKQCSIVGAAQGLIQPTTEQLRVQLSLLNFGYYDSPDQYPAAGGGFTLTQRIARSLACILALLAKLQLIESVL
jgi:hypothetical protein